MRLSRIAVGNTLPSAFSLVINVAASTRQTRRKAAIVHVRKRIVIWIERNKPSHQSKAEICMESSEARDQLVGRETDPRKTFRNVRIPDAVPTPDPSAGILPRRRFLELVEPGKIHPPFIAVFRRQLSAITLRQQFHSLPRKSHFQAPAAVPVIIFVHCAIYENGVSFPGKRPLERTKSSAPGMRGKTNAIETFQSRPLQTGQVRERFIRLLPNEKRFVCGVEAIHFEFVVRIPPGNENFNVIVIINRRVVRRELCMHEWLLCAHRNINICIVPYDGSSRSMDCRLARDNIDVTR